MVREMNTMTEEPQPVTDLPIPIRRRPVKLSRVARRPLLKEALRLFLEEVSVNKIAQRLELHKNTIYLWAAQGGWHVLRQKIFAQDVNKIANVVQDMKERHLKITRAIQTAMEDKLRRKVVKITVPDALKAMEHEARLLVPESYNPQSAAVAQITTITNVPNFVQLLEQAKKEKAEEQADGTSLTNQRS